MTHNVIDFFNLNTKNLSFYPGNLYQKFTRNFLNKGPIQISLITTCLFDFGEHFKANNKPLGHHPRDVEIFLGDYRFLPIKKLKIDFLDGESEYFQTFSTR